MNVWPRMIAVVLFSSAVACGPPIDNKRPSFNSSPNNSSMNNTSTNNTGTNNTGTNSVTATNSTSTNSVTPTNNTSTNSITPTNNTSTNNTSTNNTSTNNTNTNNSTNSNDGVEAKCLDFCQLLTGDCVTNNCTLDANTETARQDWFDECTGAGSQSCQFRYRNESQYAAEVDDLLTVGCSGRDWNQIRCRNFGTDVCDCEAPTYGTQCTSDNDCDGGILNGYCAPENADANPGGQCLAAGCWFPDGASNDDIYAGPTTGCGEQGICYVVDAANYGAVCLASCEVNSDCERHVTGPNQSGYACTQVGEFQDGSLLGICQTACSTDDDCEADQRCTADFACQFSCETDADCGGAGITCSGTSQGGDSVCVYTG